MKSLKEELQNSNIINMIRDFSDASINNQKIDKKDCICVFNLLKLRKVLQDHYKEIKKSIYLSNKDNLKKDKNA